MGRIVCLGITVSGEGESDDRMFSGAECGICKLAILEFMPSAEKRGLCFGLTLQSRMFSFHSKNWNI